MELLNFELELINLKWGEKLRRVQEHTIDRDKDVGMQESMIWVESMMVILTIGIYL